jgi:GntR family transcriptional regulator, rspAB operon transcriptional repressor
MRSSMRKERVVSNGQSAWLHLHQTLKGEILAGTLHPGHAFTESELARRFKVSRTPVREALSALEKDGLVRRLPNRGYVVSTVTMDEVLDLLQMRVILEREAARRVAIRKGPEVADELERINSAGLKGEMDPIEANHRFHQVLANETGNRMMAEVLNMIHERFMRLAYGYTASLDRDQILSGHPETIDALRRHDPEAAAVSIVQQLGQFQDRILRR